MLGLVALLGVLRTPAASPKWKISSGLLAVMAIAIGGYQVAHRAGLM